jgi:hypothetical protein
VGARRRVFNGWEWEEAEDATVECGPSDGGNARGSKAKMLGTGGTLGDAVTDAEFRILLPVSVLYFTRKKSICTVFLKSVLSLGYGCHCGFYGSTEDGD